MSVELPKLPDVTEHWWWPETVRQAIEQWGRAAVDAALERAAQECDRIANEHWAAYKGRDGSRDPATHYNPHEEGVSDGAGECADAIRALGEQHD